MHSNMEGAEVLGNSVTSVDSSVIHGSDRTYLHSGRAAVTCLAPSALRKLLARLNDVNALMVGTLGIDNKWVIIRLTGTWE